MIHVLTAFTKDLGDLINLTKIALENYVKKYQLTLHYHIINDNYSRPYSWYKIEAIQELFKIMSPGELVWWLDADTLILNDRINIYSLVSNKSYDMYLTKDWHGPNLGVFLIRNTDYSKTLLNQIWNMETYINHGWWEQAALHYMIDENLSNINNHISYVPQQILNAYECSLYDDRCKDCQVHRKKSLVLHMPNLSMENRFELIFKYSKFLKA